MGLQDRIKKVQDFEKSLDSKLETGELTREKQIDNIKREIHMQLITELSDDNI